MDEILDRLGQIEQMVEDCQFESQEPQDGSKLGWHFQSIPGWAPGVVNSQWVKVIDPPEQDPFPGRNTICRFFMDDGQSNELVRRGLNGAREWVGWLTPKMEDRPWAAWVEGPNEPLGADLMKPKWRRVLDEFTQEFARLCQIRGWFPVGFNFSVGWPHTGTCADFAGGCDSLTWAGGMVGLHEYGAPSMRDGGGYWTLRYRKFLAELEYADFEPPYIFIGECGIDGLLLQPQPQGWMHYASEQEYMDQLIWYDSELRKDPEVIAAVPFTSGPMNPWFSYDVNESLSHRVATHIQTVG